jgi:hypothetical protein
MQAFVRKTSMMFSKTQILQLLAIAHIASWRIRER